MAIESINNNVAGLTSQNKAAAKSSADIKNRTAAAATKDNDIVSLTTTATDIKNASETGSSEPVINESRIAEIKAALQNGNYQINPEQIAEKMLRIETNLPNTT